VPTRARPENKIIELFVSAYENDSWKGAHLTFPDEVKDGGIDGFVERADGATLAIEHTVVEPFVGDIADQTEMIPMFPLIENDKSLLVPNIWIRLFVPVGTLHLQKPRAREAIVSAVHDWLRINRLSLPKGNSWHPCRVTAPGKPDIRITLTLKVVDLAGEGKLNVHRQQVGDTFTSVIEKMLTKKLPKLVETTASRRILLLERRHMNLLPERIYEEVENLRAMFLGLDDVHEIWIVENIPFPHQKDGNIRFELWSGGEVTRSFDFQDGKLFTRYEGEMEVLIQ
jgi:hypothetical protein